MQVSLDRHFSAAQITLGGNRCPSPATLGHMESAPVLLQFRARSECPAKLKCDHLLPPRVRKLVATVLAPSLPQVGAFRAQT